MKNAKEELERLLKGKAKVRCASIFRSYYDESGEHIQNFELKVNHTEEEFESFLESLDFVYDSGFGAQELFGTIWLDDGTWCTRGEYNGSEWWKHNKLPEIPSKLL